MDAPNAYPGRAGKGPVAALAHPVNLNVRAEDKIPMAGSTGHCNYQHSCLLRAYCHEHLDKGTCQMNDFCTTDFC